MIAFDILLIVILFSLFAASHTWLASRKLKISLAEKIGDKIAFYRLFYNLSSLIFFSAFIALSPKPDLIIYDLQYPFDLITFALQVLSFIGLIWAVRPIDLKEFIGIAQVERYFRQEYPVEELDEKTELKIVGAFRYVRHPVYLFSILFLGFRPQMSLFYLVTFFCTAVYFHIGSIFEERKLVAIFGDQYREYQSRVPRLFPL
jgi:methanethiol S-methyltransferase